MVAQVDRRRIEVLVDEPLLAPIIQIARKMQVSGYTILPTLAGEGLHGRWADDQLSGAQHKVIFMAVMSTDKADRFLDELAPAIDAHGLIVLDTTVRVLRPDKF